MGSCLRCGDGHCTGDPNGFSHMGADDRVSISLGAHGD